MFLSQADVFKIHIQIQIQINLNTNSTGLSYFHKMAVTVLKASFTKTLLKEMLHRDYKNFEQDKFKHELKNIIQNESVECYCEFEKVFVDILNK